MNDTELKELGTLLIKCNSTVAVAESCTGGLLGNWLTNISGSSKYFMGGIISYSNESKQNVLGVKEDTLIKYGAVSKETAQEMAKQTCLLFGTTYGLSTTGIAGPTGGTPEKPVGLVYIGLGTPEKTLYEKHIWTGNRVENKEYSVIAALHLLYKHLKSLS